MRKFVKGVIMPLLIFCFIILGFSVNVIAKSLNNTKAVNKYPVVLVHGFLGWGRDEGLGFKYWGGFNDIEKQLERDTNHEVYTASVGPVASNWDRACELYAYIKGGTVDYGKAHSRKHGHARFGRTYKGLYPKWGEVNPETGKIYKVHLIGHSMGGETIRVIAQLLEQGRKEEIANTNPDELSPLFKGEHKWISSITTISTPHDGTSILGEKNRIIERFAQKAIGSLGALSGNRNRYIYDFKLDQWGLKRRHGERPSIYYDRVLNSSIWNTKDIAKWDLSPRGAKELNEWVKAQTDIYYFSWTTKATKKLRFTGRVIPDFVYMNPLMKPTSAIMCKYTNRGKNGIVIDRRWFENDGAVNCISANGPKLGSTDKIVKFNGTPQIGKWNDMGIIYKTDHMDIVGIGIGRKNLRYFYDNIVKLVSSLEN